MEVRDLHMGRVGDPSGMRSEHLKNFIRETTQEKDPDTQRWDKLVSLTKMAFQEGRFLVVVTWTIIVIIPKGGENYRGIVLVEVIWNVFVYIINNRL